MPSSDISTKTYAELLDERRQKISAVRETYSLHAEFADSLGRATELRLFEGLPHPTWEADLHSAEIKGKETVRIQGYRFYAYPIEPSQADKERLVALYSDGVHIVPFKFFKMCGGYHPDWCIAWKDGDEECCASFCFGCGESDTISGDRKMTCDLENSKAFKSVFDRHRRSRPLAEDD